MNEETRDPFPDDGDATLPGDGGTIDSADLEIRRTLIGPDRADDGLAEGSRFGPFRILGELGRGGMGVVYRAEQDEPRRVVALKILRRPVFDRSALEIRFEREIEAAGSLKHDHIVRVHVAGRAGEYRWYAMELVEGVPLSEAIGPGGMEFGRAARIARQIALALAHAHEKGIVHRDVKPANVILRRNAEGGDHAVVVDFGLALLGGGSRISVSGNVLGTPVYMAPEQAMGDTSSIDARTDVYGLGATLYELLTGRTVHRAASYEALLAAVLRYDPASPRAVRPETPVDLESICLRMLAKRPAERYQTAGEAAEDLGRFLTGEAVLARPPGRFDRALRRWRRGRAPWIGVGAFSLVAALGIAFASFPRGGDPDGPVRSSAPTRGSIRVDLRPPGARIVLSGPEGPSIEAESPHRFAELPPGTYDLRASLGSPFRDVARTIDLAAGQDLVEAGDLEIATGRLAVTVDPPGSMGRLRRESSAGNSFETDLEIATPFDGRVPVGTYRFRVHGPDDPDGRRFRPIEGYVLVVVEREACEVDLRLTEPSRVLWRREAGFELADLEPLLADLDGDGVLDPILVGGGRPGRVLALAGRTGEVLWIFDAGGEIGARPALARLDDDGVLDAAVVLRDGRVVAVSGRTGDRLWDYETSHFAYSTPAFARLDDDGTLDVLVASWDRHLHAVGGAGGRPLWKYPASAGLSLGPAVADLDGDRILDAVVVAAGSIHAVRGASGEGLWIRDAGEELATGPAVADLDGDGVPDVVAGAKRSGRLFAANGRNGEVLWTREGSGYAASVVVAGDLDGDGAADVFAASGDRLDAVSGRTGRDVWIYDAASPLALDPRAGDLDGDGVLDLVAVTKSEVVHALSGRTGKVLWTLDLYNGLSGSSPALGDLDGDGRADALVATNNEVLRAVRGTDGRELWRIETDGHGFHSSAALTDLDGDGSPDAIAIDRDGGVWAIRARAD